MCRVIIYWRCIFVASSRLLLLALCAFLLHTLTPNKVAGLLFDTTEPLAVGVPVR
jgi:hypothetical protein